MSVEKSLLGLFVEVTKNLWIPSNHFSKNRKNWKMRFGKCDKVAIKKELRSKHNDIITFFETQSDGIEWKKNGQSKSGNSR